MKYSPIQDLKHNYGQKNIWKSNQQFESYPLECLTKGSNDF